MQFIFATVPNQVANNQVLTVEFCTFFKKVTYLYLFHELTYRSNPSTDFHALWLKRRELAQRCAFWGFRWHCSPF